MDNYGTHKVNKVRTWLVRHARYYVNFTPTSGSWLNLVERLFAEATERCGAEATRRFDQGNKDPKSFVCHADADLILARSRDCLKEYLTQDASSTRGLRSPA
jgi:hypothetical protein